MTSDVAGRKFAVVGFALLVASTVVRGQAPATPVTGLGVVEGTVYDSLLTKGPVVGATVYAIGSNLTATTDRRGRFAIAGFPEGEHTFTFSHRTFDSAGVQPPQVAVRVAAAAKARVAIATPSGAALVKATCAGPVAEKTGLLLGLVRDVDSGAPLPGARVSSRWFEMTIDNGGPRYQTLETAATADRSGVFRLCGVPADVPVFVRAVASEHQSGRVEVYFNGSDVAFRDFAISVTDSAARAVADSVIERATDSASAAAPRGSAVLRGTVRDETGRAVGNVTVGVLDLYRTVVTDSGGRFTLGGIPAGTQTIELRAIGFAPARKAVALRTSTVTDTIVQLDRAAQTLASVRVLGDRSRSRSFSGFEDRRRRGVGFFMDAEEIAKKSGIYLGDVLRFAPGMFPNYTSRGRTFTMRSMASGDRCSPAYFLDGIRWYALEGSPILELERFIPLQDLAAVEVYSGGASTPAQFDTGSGCGAVVFWTKR
jgi:hypothetical protein